MTESAFPERRRSIPGSTSEDGFLAAPPCLAAARPLVVMAIAVAMSWSRRWARTPRTPCSRRASPPRRRPGGRRRRRQRHRRQRRHPLVQPVQRPAVDARRPRRHRHHQPGRAAVGGRVRARRSRSRPRPTAPPGPHLHHHHRRRRHADAQRDRLRPVRAHVRHRARHRLRLLAVRVQGVRLARRPRTNPGRAAPTNAAQGKTGHRLVVEARTSPPPTPSTATPAPAGPASSATRSGSQVDLGAHRRAICQVVLQWEAAYGKAFQIQISANATTWTDIYSTTTGTGGTADPHRDRHRPVRAHVRHRPRQRLRLLAVGVQGLSAAGGAATPPTTPPTPSRPAATGPTVWTDDFDGAANTSPSRGELAAADRHPVPRRRGELGHRRGRDASSDVDRQRLPRRRRQAEHQGDPGRRRRLDLGPASRPSAPTSRRRRASCSSSPPCSSSPTWPTASATGRASGPPAPPTAATTTTGRASARPTS